MFLLDSAGTKGPGVGGTVKSFSAKADVVCLSCCSEPVRSRRRAETPVLLRILFQP